MGIVTQEPILFNDTIANNIALGMDNATEEQIQEAAKLLMRTILLCKKKTVTIPILATGAVNLVVAKDNA